MARPYSNLKTLAFIWSLNHINLIENLHKSLGLRAFHELPKHLYAASTTTQQEAETKFLNHFVKNGAWLLNKPLRCHSALYLMHDIEMFKNLFIKNISSDVEEAATKDREEFHLIEKLVYRHLYDLYQNPCGLGSVLSRELNLAKQKGTIKLLEQLRKEVFTKREEVAFTPEFKGLSGEPRYVLVFFLFVAEKSRF